MNKHLCLLAALLLAIFSGFSHAAQPSLSIGLFPNLSTRLLLETYQPMREFLEQKLGYPVTLYTAPDFNSFVSRTQSGEYDVIVTAPHFARLAQTDSGYQPLFAYRNNIMAAIVVAKNSRFSEVKMLGGQKIASPDRLAIVTMLGLKILSEHGLEADRDYTFQWVASHGNVALAVLRGEVQAGILGSLPLKQLPQATSSQLRVISTTPAVASQIMLANRRLTPERLQQLKEILLQFESSDTGSKFFQSSGLGGLKPIGPNDLTPLEPYARDVKRMMGPPK